MPKFKNSNATLWVIFKHCAKIQIFHDSFGAKIQSILSREISVKVTYNKRAVIICQKQQIEKSVKDNICRGPFHFQSSSGDFAAPRRHYFPAPSSHPVTHGKISFNLHLGGLTSQLNDLETVVEYRTGCANKF